MVKYNYCPQCKSSLNKRGERYFCSNCGAKIYIDPKPTASVLLVKNSKVLLTKRAVEPHKGGYDPIGGFLEKGELPEEAAVREAKEETGLDIKIIELLGMHTERYGKNGDYQINIYYVGEIVGGKPRANDDVASLHWFPIDKVPKMPFKSANEAVKDLQRWYKNELKSQNSNVKT